MVDNYVSDLDSNSFQPHSINKDRCAETSSYVVNKEEKICIFNQNSKTGLEAVIDEPTLSEVVETNANGNLMIRQTNKYPIKFNCLNCF
jgi:hypothetical protein